jgi:hypothetical protein
MLAASATRLPLLPFNFSLFASPSAAALPLAGNTLDFDSGPGCADATAGRPDFD